MFHKSCAMCKYLDISKKKDGANAGSIYHCIKCDKFINTYQNNICESYDKDYSRKRDLIDTIEENSKKFDDRKINLGEAIFALIIIIILGLISLIFSLGK